MKHLKSIICLLLALLQPSRGAESHDDARDGAQRVAERIRPELGKPLLHCADAVFTRSASICIG